MRPLLIGVLMGLAFVGACSSDDDSVDTTTTTTTTSAERTATDVKVEAQEMIGRHFSGADYECDEPASADPGTSFRCAGELNGQEIHWVVGINGDGSLTLTLD